MTWATTWADILSGGPGRWKVDDLGCKKQALAHIEQHSSTEGPMRILCPLAGDDPFVHYAWSQGHDVTAIDIVPAAMKVMRGQFGADAADWSAESKESETVWTHKSGRATLIEGDMLTKRPELIDSFDAVYDKDCFGALELQMRPGYCNRIAEFAKTGATIYVEVKNKASGRENGPPFHVEKADLTDEAAYGGCFEYVASLGEVYPLKMPGMQQMGHVLRRLK
ncbi:hypothetical protein ACHAXT_007608 [Thalassiosira profunda]